MSLSEHLTSGELGAWFTERFSDPAGRARLLEQAEAAVEGREPVRPPGGHGPGEAALAEMALAQRLAFAVEPAPPYYALLGAHRSGLVDVARAHAAAGDFPTHTPLDMVVRIRRLDRRPTPAGWIDAASPVPWRSYHDEVFGPITLASDPPTTWNPDDAGRSPGEVLGLCSWLSSALRDVAPPGRLADPTVVGVENLAAPVTETSLAAGCVTLATWEHAYRTGQPLPVGPAYDSPTPRDGVTAVQAMLAAPEPAIVADVAAMAARAADSGALDALHTLAGRASTRVPLGRHGPVPFGYARPVLVPHWADAAAVIGDAGTPGGTTLLTVAAPERPPGPAELLRWCHRLLALRWLDGYDLYRVGRVALYLARHGSLLTWPADDLAAGLAGPDPDTRHQRHARLRALREEFATIAGRAITTDGADPRWTRPPPGTSATRGTHQLLTESRGEPASRTRPAGRGP